MTHYHYVSRKLEGRISPNKGRGLFALEWIAKDELLLVWGGFIVDGNERQALSERQQSLSITVEENLYFVPFKEEIGDWVNHSCEPNAWLVGQITLFARRDIQSGEEICFDYATCLGINDPADEFECSCGQLDCRKRVTANDWRIPALQERYAGHFSPYLQRRIDKLKLLGSK